MNLEKQKMESDYQVSFGADPEGFFKNKDGLIVGSELVIPRSLKGGYNTSVVRDGVQLEMHPGPEYCREEFAVNIEQAFRLIKDRLELKKDFDFCFEAVVRMTPGQLNKLSAKSRMLGCAPSENIYNKGAKINVNPKTYMIRSAGGHVHLGIDDKKLREEYQRIIRMCDVLLGNQCVLLDRNPLMKLRRRVYGRAGECRRQKYGVEYRTLSNFWLRSEPLVSFVLAMARQAVRVIATTDGTDDYADRFDLERIVFDYVKIRDVIKAINNNDFDLAMKNFEGIAEFIKNHFPDNADGLNSRNINKFVYMANKVNEKGIEFWFPSEPLDYWTLNKKYGTSGGWEKFLRTQVKEVN